MSLCRLAWTDIKKVIEMGPYMLGTMAGGAADNQHWLRVVQRETRFDPNNFYPLIQYFCYIEVHLFCFFGEVIRSIFMFSDKLVPEFF